jgi:putative endonuclease
MEQFVSRACGLGANNMQAAANKPFWVYILASKRNGTLYIGSTDDLGKRVWQHKTEEIKGFTSKYGVKQLVWYEAHETREKAFLRERRMKEWKRAWKIKLIEEMNLEWRDLYETLNW